MELVEYQEYQDYELQQAKYVTLVGYIQSGKTNELLNYCYQSINFVKVPVIFILRNIKADLLQLDKRFSSFFENNKQINVSSLSQLFANPDLGLNKALAHLANNGIIILLCNTYQLRRIIEVLDIYTQDGKYNLCIDEVDFSIKSKDLSSSTDKYLKIIKSRANHILGATATPFAVFSTDKSLSKIKKIKVNNNYKGINSLTVKFVEPVIIKNLNLFPYCDHLSMNTIYSSCLSKNECVLLHTVIKEKIYQTSIMNYVNRKYKSFTTVLYNGDGIVVKCPMRNNIPFTKPKTFNDYKQLINKYSMNSGIKGNTGNITHYFENYSISEVLQLLKNDSEYCHSHISIISGHLASRGISFVSSDYSVHLTDQYFHPGKKSHGENILQSLRILGCYKDSKELTLWCSKNTWKDVLEQQLLIDKLVNCCQDSRDWFVKIQEISLNRPRREFTRHKINNYSWNSENLILSHYSSESESESE